MSWPLILALAAITYASRASALALLPSLPPRVRLVLDRMPAALFAGLAAHSIVSPGGMLADGATLAAGAAAIAVTPFRSLFVCLIAGVAAYFAFGLVVPAG